MTFLCLSFCLLAVIVLWVNDLLAVFRRTWVLSILESRAYVVISETRWKSHACPPCQATMAAAVADDTFLESHRDISCYVAAFRHSSLTDCLSFQLSPFSPQSARIKPHHSSLSLSVSLSSKPSPTPSRITTRMHALPILFLMHPSPTPTTQKQKEASSSFPSA